MTTYHVDATNGSDRNDGLSSFSAWKTLARATKKALKPGDRLLLSRGSSWAEPLRLNGQGTPSHPILLAPYGEGPRPKILVRDEAGISADRPISAWTIRGLEVAGEKPFDPYGHPPGKTAGIVFHQTERCAGLRIEDCLVHDVPGAGIALYAGKTASTVFAGWTIADCEVHHAGTGITTGGPWPAPKDATKLIEKFTISGCRVHDIVADGIVLSHCRDGVIERCVAWKTGVGRVKRTPVGIWFFMARRCTIQFCESFDNHTAGGKADGGGFDLDGGCIECVMQYNYSHDNDGAGYLICSYDPWNAPCLDCVTRYNLSINDGLANDYASILFWQADDCRTYNNTLITRSASPLKFTSDTKGNTFANNLFVVDSTHDIALVKSAFALDRNTFRNNAYYRTGGRARFEVQAEKFMDFASFSRRLRTEGEFEADPRLDSLSTIHVNPRPGSPLLGAGMKIASAGSRDLLGFDVPRGAVPAIGCSQRPAD